MFKRLIQAIIQLIQSGMNYKTNFNRKNIIVTADDFGISSKANKNILDLAKAGKLDRVGVMTHGMISSREVSELMKTGVSLDIHLDILHEFEDKRKKRAGAIIRILDFLKKIATGKLSNKKVLKDWERQIELFKTMFGKNPDGINSHEHVHLFPSFFKIALKLRKKYAIPYLRFGDSIYSNHTAPVAFVLHCLRKFNKKLFKSANCNSSASLVSIDWIDDLDSFLLNLPTKGQTELVCHPELSKEFHLIQKYF